MSDAVVAEVRAIQAFMVESAGARFLASELEDMRCLIRLKVEFDHYLQGHCFSELG